MLITRYFTSVPDVIYSGECYRALYATLLKAASVGLGPDLRLDEHSAPAVTLCNAIRTLVEEIRPRDRRDTYIRSYAGKLAPEQEEANPDPETLSVPVYPFHPHTEAERTAILALSLAIAHAGGVIGTEEYGSLLAAAQDAGLSRADIDTFTAAYEENLVRKDPDRDLQLEQYGLALSCLRSVERTLEGKSPEVQQELLNRHIEAFIGEDDALYRIVAEMLIQRLTALDTETRYTQSAAQGEPSAREDTATASQTATFFYYLFAKLGIHFGNSDKTAWARLIHWLSGKNEKNIKDRLLFDFDKKATQKDLAAVIAHTRDLLPEMARTIEKDKEI